MEQALAAFIYTTWDIIKLWWWVLVPFILWHPFSFIWLWWRNERWWMAQKMVLLEIKMPKEVLRPLRAMEQVFSAFWGNVYDPPDWWEKWFEGKTLLSIQLEMVSLGGEPHFYIRVPEDRRNAIEASIYSQYPDAEITVVDDYTKYVPQDIPNKDWDLWGTDFFLNKDDVYPIKTYPFFFEEKPEIAKEEKRLDPIATLLEGMGTLGPGEHLWIQISASPVTEGDTDFFKRGREEADKIAKRPLKKEKPIWREAVDLITGKGPEKKEEEPLIPPEMKLTPGERIKVEGVERKISHRCFLCFMRFIYLARRDVFFGGAKAAAFGFFAQFATEDLNTPRPWSKTITKIHHYPILDLIRPRRVYLRKRRMFSRYINRLPPLFPKSGKIDKGRFVLDTEELATLFHFPGKTVAPASFMPRIEAKKGEAPPGLPME